MFARSPFSIVTVVARVKGYVSENMLLNAVSKVQLRHPNLRVRIEVDPEHDLWFTSEGVKEIPVQIVPRESDDHWIKVHQDASRVPFDFDRHPAVRFILVQSPTQSELVILCHHILCDGLSLAYLARDLLVHIGDPTQEVETLPDPVPIDKNNMPKEVSLNPVVKFFINRINKQWETDKIFFDQEDYLNIHEAYWKTFHHNLFSVELSEAQTSGVVERCRTGGVTVNSALATAFAGAYSIVQGDKLFDPRIGVAASVRDMLVEPVADVMGFYAGLVTLKFNYAGKKSFWENARLFHQKVHPLYTNKNLFKDFMLWFFLEPAILESIHFKKLGGLVLPHSTRYSKLSDYSKQDDVVLSILKRDKMDSLDKTVMGIAVTNLTRMEFPRKYGSLELDRLILHPGGGFPLVNVPLVLGAVTCAGKLSLVVEFAEEAVDTRSMEKIKDQALEFLLEGQKAG